ncbi:hypothetical protein ECC02_010585 [Trypanosoma cruzi]|uniref:Uncharacterized protein n=1 Tax=Trypanosoma cruzi TaxID=5693 RepID=A0A7J6XQ69_TRYCR|nr:hypothetical protein ECC02_010585 [Trypanosoma cruzi]
MESNRGDERCGRHTQRAHHMRRGQQPGMHRTPHTTHDTHSNPRQQAHTHTQPCRNTNTQMEEGDANRSGTQGSTACTYGESGPSCLHPSRRVRTHTRGSAAHTATQKQSNNKNRGRSSHTTWIVGPQEAQPIFITKTIQLCLALVHIRRTSLHAGLGTSAAAAAKVNISLRNGIMQATIYLCFCLNVGRCPHAFCSFCFVFQMVNLHASVVCWGFLQDAQLLFLSSCECFLCWCGQ